MDSNKTVIVTGAGSGIGRATAIRFAAAGYCVYGADIDNRGMDAVAAEIGAGKGVFVPYLVDVSDERAVKALVDRSVQTHGALHAVVACAGVAWTGLAHELELDKWNRLLAINLTGTFLLAKHAMRHLCGARSGSFVAISSDAGVRGASGYAAYCASKHGVIGLIRCLALDYGRFGIRSNAVCPGFVQTKMMHELFEQTDNPAVEIARYMEEVPTQRFALPSEVANVVFHLASDEASYTNGMCYAVDGGVTAGHL